MIKPLHLIRLIFGITLKDLSKLSGISMGFLCEVENGRMPTLVMRQRIIDALKVCIVSKLTQDNIFEPKLESVCHTNVRKKHKNTRSGFLLPEILDARAKGLSFKEIGKKFNVSRQYIHQIYQANARR